MWRAVQSVQCLVLGAEMQFPVHLQVQVQCVMYTMQFVGCSVLPAKNVNLSVKTG